MHGVLSKNRARSPGCLQLSPILLFLFAIMSTSPTTPVVDLVTSLQEAMGRLNAMLFNYVGALQRDAPPQSLKHEPVVGPPKSYDVLVRGREHSRGHGRRRWRQTEAAGSSRS